MKKLLFAGAASVMMVACQPQEEAKTLTIENEVDSVSYAIGLSIGQNLQQGELSDLDLDLIFAGIEDKMDTAAETKIEEAAAQSTIQSFYMKKQKAKMEEEKLKHEGNVAIGEKFLEENKNKEGIVVTESGLQYMVMTEGDGEKPAASDKVSVHYHGTLIDGTVFDSSVDRGEPAQFPVMGVIKGWQEVLQLMPAGSKYKVFIPSSLAYGERAAGAIPPFSTLIFEVELLEIL